MKRGKETNFDKASEQQVLDQFPYDYTSVTHYALRVTLYLHYQSLIISHWMKHVANCQRQPGLRHNDIPIVLRSVHYLNP